MTTTPTTESIVAKLLEVLRLRDPAIADHGQRTADIAVAIGVEMGCTVDTLDHLYLASQLHDLGKLGVPETILWKPAGLNHTEWREIRTRIAEIGASLGEDDGVIAELDARIGACRTELAEVEVWFAFQQPGG